MATVYLAQDLKHDRKVAIKVLRPELAAVIGAERFLSEIKTTANLQHPHILPLHDSGRTVGQSDGRTEEFLFYVMPYVEGESLRDRLNREKQLPINDAIRIASEVAGALDYAHRHGIIHRDIKPENILLHDGRALVADFGIALAVSTAGTRMTETGMSLGTPHYMSPEQAMGDRELTPRSDVYALGAMTYEMLLGEPPFTGPTAQSIVAKVMTEKPAAIIPRRDRVPVQVEDAVLRALEKLPADRFATAAEFAAALSSDTWTAGQTSRRPAAQPSASPWRPIALGAFAIAGAAVLGLTYAVARARPLRGPSEYDVGLPDSAGMVLARGNFAVAPGGGFAVYPAMRNGHTALWYRSLLDATTRRIEGTEDATQPTVSPDGGQIAFIRSRGAERTVEVMTIGGGRATTLARLSSLTSLEWLADGRILAVEGDGRKARWLDPGGGPATTINLRYCILPAPLPDQNALLCGGGGAKYGYRIDIRDTLSIKPMRTGAADSGLIFGSDFRVIDGRYLTYMSNGGDLLATSIDLATGRAGRPVRMATGLGLRDYTGAGSFALSESGTLVYALGTNHAVGYLVRAGARSLDTLPVGREAFLRFSVSPDGRRLAAVVEVLEGEELRVYDLETGKHLVWLRHPQIRQPIWSPRGDRLSFTVFSSGSTGDSVFVRSPTTTGAPELAFIADFFEGFTWLPDGRLIGGSWRSHLGMAAQLDRRPVSFDTLLREASFVRVSPDAKWISYNTVELDELWVEPFPRTGKRYQVYAGVTEDGQWLSPSELAFFVADPPRGFDLVRLDPRADPPLTGRRRWIDTPRILGTAGQSSALTPDGRLVYVQGD
jgi:serine/threonine-protein kinase